ncbi:hypothetical protein MNBD_ALPHA12-452 [hydrothermal vent metagenome]|uniref:Uncharacterized protein n=1 Tax=hydrothermal vent metagenome TaxID=652676 RepID=A0A3B0TIF1_9ZZZZ
MAGITLAIAEARLTAYLDAEAAVLNNQSYDIDVGGSRRSMTRADLAEVRKGIEYWSGLVNRLSNAVLGGSRSRYMVR